MGSGTTADLGCVWGPTGVDVFGLGSDATLLRFNGKAWWPLSGAGALTPLRVFLIGDCRSWFLERYFPRLVASGDLPRGLEVTGAVEGGQPLEYFWVNGTRMQPLPDLMAGKEKWDFGVINISYGYEEPDVKEYTDWVPKFDEVFKRAGAQTVLTTSWPWQPDVGTSQKATEVADRLAAQLGARVAPVGLAVERVMRERPGLIEYVDENHVNAPGWYLSMCVLYATLFERSPEGLKYRLNDALAGSDEGFLWKLPTGWALSDEDAAYLQRVAWETVKEHQAQK